MPDEKNDIIDIRDEIYKDIYSTNQATESRRGKKIILSQAKTYACIQYSYRIRISVDFSMLAFGLGFGSLNKYLKLWWKWRGEHLIKFEYFI